MNSPQRNHILSLIRNPIITLLKEAFTMIFFYYILIDAIGPLYTIAVIIGVFMLSVFFTIASWYKQTYYFQSNMIIYQKGILNIVKREVPFDKINTVDISQNIFDRIFNLAKIKIDTGSTITAKTELVFIINYDKAVQLKKILLTEVFEEQKEEDESFIIINKELIIFSLVSNSILKVVAVAFAIFFFAYEIAEFIGFDLQITYDLIYDLPWVLIGVVAVIAFIFSLVVSLVLIIIKYYGFSVSTRDNRLYIEYGLINKKKYSFDRDKIKGIHFKQNILMQLTKTSIIELDAAGYGDEKNEQAILYPFCNEKMKNKLLSVLLPEFDFKEVIHKAPRRAYIRFVLPQVITLPVVTAFGIGMIFEVTSYAVIGALVMIPLAFSYGHLLYKNARIGVTQDLAYFSRKGFFRRSSIIKIAAIQSVIIKRSFFQKRKKVNSYRVNIWGSLFNQMINVENIDVEFEKEFLAKL